MNKVNRGTRSTPSGFEGVLQPCQVSRISREIPAFERSLPLTRRVKKIFRITQTMKHIYHHEALNDIYGLNLD